MRSMVEGAWRRQKRTRNWRKLCAACKKRQFCPLRLASLATSPAPRGRSHVPPSRDGDFVQSSHRGEMRRVGEAQPSPTWSRVRGYDTSSGIDFSIGNQHQAASSFDRARAARLPAAAGVARIASISRVVERPSTSSTSITRPPFACTSSCPTTPSIV